MSPGNILELLIILVIVVGIGAAVWRGGARNPVGTGGLDKKITDLSGQLKATDNSIRTQIAGVVTKVDDIEGRVEAIERDAVTPADIRRLEKSVEKLAKALPDLDGRLRAQAEKQGEHAATSAATAATVGQIAEQVRLIMSVIVPKGMQ